MAQLNAFTDFFLTCKTKADLPFVRSQAVVLPSEYFSLSRLAEQITNPLLSPDWLQVTLQGQAMSFDEDYLWKFVQHKKLCFIDKERMDDAIAKGASVVLEGLDILDPKIHALCSEIDSQLPCALINCEAFFSQKNNEAYFGHRDSDDVLVMQIEGKKRWRIHEPQQRRYRGNSPLTEQQMGPLLTELVMEPGDIMFVRAGVPHRCITETPYSLHLSFDLCDRTPNIEQITHAANQFYAESLAPMNATAAEVVERYITQLKSEGFADHLRSATQDMKNQIERFRKRMGNAQRISSFEKFIK
jgi:ribosomal protein L16 Arg81 hydroxylase